MIGDWVYNKDIDKPMQVYRIIISQMFRQTPNATTEDYNIFPIPLTQEILEKNGFKEYNGLYRLDIAEGVFVNVDFESKEPFVSIHNTCYRATPICKYVHQLQHVLRLCGINHEIIL
jgi:hypothetical protein